MPENEILKDLFFIERGFLNGNHFVYRSDAPILIDTAYISDFNETEKSITRLGANLAAVGEDLLKKIIVYTLMMKKVVPADALFSYLMQTYWFKETVDLYFKSRYEAKYEEVMNSFLRRGIIKAENGDLYTTVKP